MTKAAIYLGYTFAFCITLFYVNTQNQRILEKDMNEQKERIASIQYLYPVQANEIIIQKEKIILREDFSGYYDEIRYDEFL